MPIFGLVAERTPKYQPNQYFGLAAGWAVQVKLSFAQARSLISMRLNSPVPAAPLLEREQSADVAGLRVDRVTKVLSGNHARIFEMRGHLSKSHLNLLAIFGRICCGFCLDAHFLNREFINLRC
jgi:hypothetical protein